MLAGAFAAIFGGATLILEAIYGSWYNFYVFRLPAEIQNVGHVTLAFWSTDILRPMGLGFALAVGYVVTTLARRPDRRTLFYPILGTTLILTSWITRTHSGAFDNVLIPAYAGIAMLSALAIHAIARESGGALAGYAQAMCLAQLALLAYNPIAQLPAPGDRAIGEQLVHAISQAPGDVYVPWHGYLNELAGKRGFAHSQAVADVFRGGDEPNQTAAARRHHPRRARAAVSVDRRGPRRRRLAQARPRVEIHPRSRSARAGRILSADGRTDATDVGLRAAIDANQQGSGRGTKERGAGEPGAPLSMMAARRSRAAEA